MQFAKKVMSFLLLLILFINCESQKEQDTKILAETARLISGVTSGVISGSDKIQVRFARPMIGKELAGAALKKQVFSFEPQIIGSANWKDRQTLVFTPAHPLPMRQSYKGTLDIKTLFPSRGKAHKPFYFEFQTAGREVKDFSAELELVKANDPKYIFLKGKISFTEAVDLNTVKDATRLFREKTPVALDWTQQNDIFYFQSKALQRGKKEQQLRFSLNKDMLEISQKFRRNIILPGLTALTVSDVSVDAGKATPQLTVEFSDPLDAGQDLTGLISIKPHLPVKLRVFDKKVFVKGNFEHGKTYQLIIQPGIRSRWAMTTQKKEHRKVVFEDMLPMIRFSNSGVFLPSSNKKKILFQTVNVRAVQLEILKVFESNLGQFLQIDNLNGGRERRNAFSYNIHRVGLSLLKKELEIGTTRNRRLQHELDLQKLIPKNEKGIFLLSLTFNRKDMLYDASEENLRYTRRRYDYYSDPSSYGYLRQHGRIFKPLILSDIGLTYKQAGNKHYVYATNLLTTEPMGGVKIQLKTYQNQLAATGQTDSRGMAQFETEEKVFFVQAEQNGQRSVVKPSEMGWNISTFDTKGAQSEDNGLRAFIYSERGVYRPGDLINLSFILRNDKNTFPQDHPVDVTIKNPRNQIVKRATLKKAQDGFYNFPFKTGATDLTGSYSAEIKAGSQIFYHKIRVETIVPERLKVEINTHPTQLTAKTSSLDITLQANYLFGNPAAGLQANLEAKVYPVIKKFKKYSNFIFEDRTSKYQPLNVHLFSGKLDTQGRIKTSWKLPSFSKAPSALSALLEARVLEKGGRASKNSLLINIDPYDFYVGIDKSGIRYNSIATGQETALPVILVNSKGQAQSGRTLQYKIYRNERHWWWEYNSRQDYQLRFKSDSNTELISKGQLISANTPQMLRFTPQERGKYLIEVKDGNGRGHTAAVFVNAYPWGEAPDFEKNAGVLAIKSDKKKYAPGDKARISFPAPKHANILLTIEKGQNILKSEWYKSSGGEQTSIEIPVSKAMLPTAYVSVSVIQPQQQTDNDRPIRMYGVVPLNVEEPSTRQEIILDMPEELQAGRSFTVNIQTKDNKPARLTIAVVDEGLLSITRFKTPDPWLNFFGKQRLEINTFDLFSKVLGANRGDIFRTFSIGGGLSEEETYRLGQQSQQKVNRFKPVSLFKGPLETDANGKLSVDFDLPDYIGAVRVMAVSALHDKYGHSEKTVPVKSDLMVLPTLPRALGPGDSFKLPVTVFAMRDGLKEVTLTVKTKGPLSVSGQKERKLSFPKQGQQDVIFDLQAKDAVGKAQVIVQAVSGKFKADNRTEIAVRASSPRISESISKTVEKGQEISITIPDKGMPGSNKATLSIHRRPNLKLKRRILWLIRYPYGCIEQTTSAAFPQLYLLDFIPRTVMAEKDVNKYINQAIQRLRKFQMSGGGFSYWPGSHKVSDWSTVYAGHFMIEARKLGYNVPQDLYESWQKYTERQARLGAGKLMERVYRNYVLALSGNAEIGAMNLLKENNLAQMSDVQRWLLAASYKLAGVESVAEGILESAGTQTQDYPEFSDSFGSALRDKAMILEQMVLFKRWRQADELSRELAEALSAQEWYSTQTTAYMLMALGKLFKATEGEGKDKRMTGTVTWPDGSKNIFDTESIQFQIPVKKSFGREVRIRLEENSTLQRAFAVVDWSGLPQHYSGATASKNLTLWVKWLDEDGMEINPGSLKQGQVFWGYFRVKGPVGHEGTITNVALTQILPSGWEIEFPAPGQAHKPEWMRKWSLGRESYKDFRDDRVMWFFDLPDNRRLDFVVKLNAVTAGRFFLPPTLVEAMYSSHYRATKKGRFVEVRAEN